MRLEKIVLNGFKSFADKTEFTFDSPITAIVGPNGCGKSNVVDAVRWVLGEQSVKSLRSGQMADVIFSGCSSRKGLGSAEVTLVLSNTTGQLPIEADEVQISRRIYKSGESEYRINNKLCRLRDIRELLMDTGIGAKAYSIIEQGQVEQLLNASKQDRRAVFEEAAGISKYKAHKKEALRKLEHTDQNLLRLADILGEVQKQLRSVKLQAGKARSYLRYTERLKELQVNYSLVEYHKNHTLQTEKREQLEQIEQQTQSVATEISREETEVSRLGESIIETENQINQADSSLVSVQSKIEQQLQRIEFLRARITEMQQRKGAAVKRVQELNERKERLEEELAQRRLESHKCERELKVGSARLTELEQSVRQISDECTRLEAELEDEKSGIIDIVRRTAQLHNELQSIGAYRETLSSQKSRLANRADSARAELEKLLTEKAQQQERLKDIEKVLDDLNRTLEAKRGEAEKIDETLATDTQRLAHGKETLSALESELAVLKDMEARREGLNNAVKSILEAQSSDKGKFGYVECLLAEVIEAQPEYSNAVEAALEGKTNTLIVKSKTALLAEIDRIEKLDGRVSFICADEIEPFCDQTDLSQLEGIKGRAVEFVTCWCGNFWARPS